MGTSLGRMLGIAAFVSMLVAGQSAGQPIVADPFDSSTFPEANAHASRTKRLHMVYLDADSASLNEQEERLWGNRSLNQWITWHAVLTRVSASEDPELFNLFAEPLRRQGWDARKHLTIVILRGTETVRVLPWFPHSDTRPGAPLFMKSIGGRKNLELKPLEVLHQSQFLLDKFEATQPIWMELHRLKNPPPPAPARVLFSGIADENAPAFAGPTEGEDAISVLERARAEVAAGSLADATASYTWVWEHLEDGRPWMRPLRRTVVAAEMRDLALKRAGSLVRFEQMRDEQAGREPWLELDDRLDRFILDEVVGGFEQTLMELDYLLNDPDEGSLLTRSENAGLKVMTSGMPWLDVWGVTRGDIDRVSSLGRSLDEGHPPTATKEEWSHVLALRRSVRLSEACRIHAALLKVGNNDEAMRVCADLLKEDADGSIRIAIVAVAWAAGVADERHIPWTDEAMALGADGEMLRRRLAAGPPEKGADAGQAPEPTSAKE